MLNLRKRHFSDILLHKLMKQLLLHIAVWCFAATTFAQAPGNDDCTTPIDLGTAPVCTNTIYTNVNATASNIGSNNIPSCFSTGAPKRDVWFVFTCPAAPLDFRIILIGVGGAASVKNPEIAVYRGDCVTDGLAELVAGCAAAAPGTTDVFLDVEALTPNAQYFIRVSDYSVNSTSNAGAFNLCVTEIPPILTIDQGGSTLCGGTIYDTGGPNGDYGPNENNTFTICPASKPACITLTLSYFNLDAGPAVLPGNPGFDMLSFYDGPDVFSPVLAQINSTSNFTGTDGGGAVCFRVQAASGCLTLNFQSDATVQFEGFEGHWTCSDSPCEPHAPIEVESAVTKVDIVKAITASGTVIDTANLTVRCPYGAYGTFNHPSDNTDLGLTKGLLLTSGSIGLVPGPNTVTDASMDNGAAGDADLNYLSTLLGSNVLSLDACVVEMDVFVATDELMFEYVFGSEEYPEYANQLYNDIFAFLASGPGITGDPNLGGARNIALLPGSTTPVQINSVNNVINWQYYRNNEVFQGSTLQYDGLTSDYLASKKSLTARVDVIPCNTYHLKLAVADRFDPYYDSGVFISEVKGGTLDLSAQYASGLDYLIENCTGDQDQIVIRLTRPKAVAASFTVTIGGTAKPGEDYLLNLPPVITFQPGDTAFYFPIIPLNDTLTEGQETITISLSHNFGCDNVVFQTITLLLNDQPNVSINQESDTLYVCAGGTIQLEASGAEKYFWEPPLAVSDPNIANPTITPVEDEWLYVMGTVASCTDKDSVFVKRINAPNLQLQPAGPLQICQGDTVQLQAITNAGASGVQWLPKTRLSDAASPAPLAYPLSTTNYIATLSVPGCPEVTKQIAILVDTLFFPMLAAVSDTVCQNTAVQLANVLHTSTTYFWTPAAGLTDSTSSGPVAMPDQTTTYTLVATSANGYCSKTGSVEIVVKPAAVQIMGPDSIAICRGDTLMLSAAGSPAGALLRWEPEVNVNPVTGPDVQISPDTSILLVATVEADQCLASDTVFVRVDSLPDLAIIPQPDQLIYCPGDTIQLHSAPYDGVHDFPGLTNTWEAFAGELGPLNQWSMSVIATMSHTFKRVSENHACKDSVSVFIPVGARPILTVTADTTRICPGDTAHLALQVDPDQAVLWQYPSGTLDCGACKTPAATPLMTTTYFVTTPDAECPGKDSIEITVFPQPALDLSSKSICLGDSVVLNDIPTNPADQYAWTVLAPGNPGLLADSLAHSPTVKPGVNTTFQVAAMGQYCRIGGTIGVSVSDATVEAGSNQTVCFGTSVTLTALTGGSTPGTLVWKPGDLPGQIIQVQPGDTTQYKAVLTFGPGCRAEDSVLVNVVPAVSIGAIQADPNEDPVCEGIELKLTVQAYTPGLSFAWTENGATIPGATQNTLSVTPAGDTDPITVRYSVVATDGLGCTASAGPFEQRVKRCFVFPNAFTPGNDSDNETFGGILTFGGQIDLVAFKIFNRWGQQVFEASPNQQAWDGRVNGKNAPADVYVYFITVRFANGDEKTFKGDVTLLR